MYVTIMFALDEGDSSLITMFRDGGRVWLQRETGKQ